MKKNPARNTNLKNTRSSLLEEINSSIFIVRHFYIEDTAGSIPHCKMLIKSKFNKENMLNIVGGTSPEIVKRAIINV